MSALPPTVAPFAARVDTALDAEVARIQERLVDLHADLETLAHVLGDFVRRGGKRLRPVFVLIGHRAAGGEDDGPALGPALAVELLHTCALVHDDLIDGADTRRGGPAAHHSFEGPVPASGVDDGAADGFGRAAALLLGDLAHVISDELFFSSPVRSERVLDAFRVFTAMREEVTAGQFLDVQAAFRRGASSEVALAIASYKSGRYSVARPLQIGAILGGEPGVGELLGEVGLPLGQAFQIRDDILGVFGVHGETGKPTDSDLAEGKRTLLVARTLERLAQGERERFEALLGKRDLGRTEAEELRDLMRRSGGLAETEATADRLVSQALQAIEQLPVGEATKDQLRALAAYLIEREA